MICYHCKKTIRRRDHQCYVPYRTRKDGPILYRRWHMKCAEDEAQFEKEYPKDYGEDYGVVTHAG